MESKNGSKIEFWVNRDIVPYLRADKRFVPRSSFVFTGDRLSDDFGMWKEDNDEDGIPIRLLD